MDIKDKLLFGSVIAILLAITMFFFSGAEDNNSYGNEKHKSNSAYEKLEIENSSEKVDLNYSLPLNESVAQPSAKEKIKNLSSTKESITEDKAIVNVPGIRKSYDELFNKYSLSSGASEKNKIYYEMGLIDNDAYLEKFFNNLNYEDMQMMSSFVLSSSRINSSNSIKLLMLSIEKLYEENLAEYLEGIKLIYYDVDLRDTLNGIDYLLSNESFILSENQSYIILHIVENVPSTQAVDFLEKNKYLLVSNSDIDSLIKKIKSLDKRSFPD